MESSSARRTTCRRSRRSATRSTGDPTSSRSARCSTSCSPATSPSRPTRRPACSSRSSTDSRRRSAAGPPTRRERSWRWSIGRWRRTARNASPGPATCGRRSPSRARRSRRGLRSTPLPTLRPAQPPPLPLTAAPTVSPRSLDVGAPPVPPRPRVPTPPPTASSSVLRRSSPTLSPGSVPAAGRRRWWPLVVGASGAVLALSAVSVALWLRGGGSPRSRIRSPSAPSAALSALTHELVRKQVQLARRELEDKNYAAAATEAEGALKLAPGDANAGAVLSTTRDRVRELTGRSPRRTASSGRVTPLAPRASCRTCWSSTRGTPRPPSCRRASTASSARRRTRRRRR